MIKSTEYNADLNGFVVVFTNGVVCLTQYTKCTHKLDANYGESLRGVYDEYDTGVLNEIEARELSDFIRKNKYKNLEAA